jgi:hypothetical protein
MSKAYDNTFIKQTEFQTHFDTKELYKLNIKTHQEAVQYLSNKYNVDASKVVNAFFKTIFNTIKNQWIQITIDRFFQVFPSWDYFKIQREKAKKISIRKKRYYKIKQQQEYDNRQAAYQEAWNKYKKSLVVNK